MDKLLKVRALNNEGIKRFAEFIKMTRQREHDGGGALSLPDNLLSDPEFLEPTDYNKEIDTSRRFSNRFEFGKYLVEQFDKSFGEAHYQDNGLWTWLALAYFDQLRGRSTQRYEHFIPYEWFNNPIDWFNSIQSLGYRHSVRTSFEVVARFGEKARFFISPKGMSFFGDASEQLLSEQRIKSSGKLRELLYEKYEDSRGFLKRGALSYPPPKSKAKNSKTGYGGVRRLTDYVLPRIKLTHDIDVMSTKRILRACGEEFFSAKTARRRLRASR